MKNIDSFNFNKRMYLNAEWKQKNGPEKENCWFMNEKTES